VRIWIYQRIFFLKIFRGKGIYEVNKEKPASDKKEVIKSVGNDEIKEIKEVKKLEVITITR